MPNGRKSASKTAARKTSSRTRKSSTALADHFERTGRATTDLLRVQDLIDAEKVLAANIGDSAEEQPES